MKIKIGNREKLLRERTKKHFFFETRIEDSEERRRVGNDYCFSAKYYKKIIEELAGTSIPPHLKEELVNYAIVKYWTTDIGLRRLQKVVQEVIDLCEEYGCSKKHLLIQIEREYGNVISDDTLNMMEEGEKIPKFEYKDPWTRKPRYYEYTVGDMRNVVGSSAFIIKEVKKCT